jgi:hypothetical protein
LRCYLVRNASSFGLLGIFWAETSERLWWLVDQANADPANYEYAELADGFLAFTGETEPVAAQIDESDHTDVPPPQFEWSGAEPSETLLTALHQQSQITWTRLPSAGEPGSGLREPPGKKSDTGDG